MHFPGNPIERPGYVLEFADEFAGTSLDRSKWLPHMLPHWSTPEASAAHYRVGGGRLQLLIEDGQRPWRPGADIASNITTGHAAGQFKFDPSLTVHGHLPAFAGYLPHFGYVETRLRACPVEGYHTALWMIGHDPGERGEIRVFELHGARMGTARTRVDYGILPWSDPALREELYEDWLPFDATEFHLYGLDWTPSHVDFTLDNKLVRRIAQSPNYRMQFMLGLYARTDEIVPGDPAPYPRVAEVDYFRGYRRAG